MSADLQTLAIARGSLAAHAPAAGAPAVERLFSVAEPLRGARIVHLTLAGAGGRVPELLSSLLPLLIPVVLIMISNHFQITTYGHQYNWIVLAVLTLVGWGAAHIVRKH